MNTSTHFIDWALADQAAQRVREYERELLDPANHYMRHAHLLPPRGEFETLSWYVAVLKLFDRAPASLSMFRFNPTLAQRRSNAETLMTWEATQRHARGAASMDKRLAGWLDNAFHNVVNDVANTLPGNRNGRLRWGARRLAELGFDKDDSMAALEDAARTNGVWTEDGKDQCRASIKSGWNKGIENPVDRSGIESTLVNRDGEN
jgi:hypothetical protein